LNYLCPKLTWQRNTSLHAWELRNTKILLIDQGKLNKCNGVDVFSWDAWLMYVFLSQSCHSRSVTLNKTRLKCMVFDSHKNSLRTVSEFLKHENRSPKHVVCGSRVYLWPLAPIETNHSSSILGICMQMQGFGVCMLHQKTIATVYKS
jgi:hypothetical protein